MDANAMATHSVSAPVNMGHCAMMITSIRMQAIRMILSPCRMSENDARDMAITMVKLDFMGKGKPWL